MVRRMWGTRGRAGARETSAGGFTLLEVVVALAVFAIIGVLSSRIVAGMIDTAEKTRMHGEALAEAQRALSIVERDVEQLRHRSVRDELGDPGDRISIGGTSLIEFTRGGWPNLLGQPRSELQRVAYVLTNEGLTRLFWPVLDRAPGTEPKAQLLLAGVTEAEFIAHDDEGEDHKYWPLPPSSNENEQQRGLAAVELRLRHATYERIERLWLIAPAPTDFLEARKARQRRGPGRTLQDKLAGEADKP